MKTRLKNNYLFSDKFFKYVSGVKRNKVMTYLMEFAQDFETLNRSELHTKYSFKRFEGIKQEIYKIAYKEIKGFRISFWIFQEDEGRSILFWRFTNHDKQVKVNKSSLYPKFLDYYKNTSKELVEDFLMEFHEDEMINPEDLPIKINEFHKYEFAFKLDKEFLNNHIMNEEELASNLLNAKEEYLYLLSEKQKSCLDKSVVKGINQPLLLAGDAGSGKSTLCAYKLLEFAKDPSNKKGLYYTYSQDLLEQTKKIFNKYANDEDKNKVDFFLFENYRKENKLPIPFSYDDFYTHIQSMTHGELKKNEGPIWIKDEENIKELWIEISAIIKGSLGTDFARLLYLDEWHLSEKDYLNTKSGFEKIEDEDNYVLAKKQVFKFFEKTYQKWLRDENKKDYSDILLEFIHAEEKEQYDFLVLDEVQDLRELEVYFLFSMLAPNKLNNLFAVGDEHQTIEDNYFSFKRMGSLYKKVSSLEIGIEILNANLRNQKKIVDFANGIAKLRQTYIANTKIEHDVQANIIDGIEPMLLLFDEKQNTDLFQDIVSNNRKYIAIVTSDKKEKMHLIKKYQELADQIFTISEIKGLEAKYVICYNIISKHHHIWDVILERKKKKQREYRKYFGDYYVAATRAQQNLYFVEGGEHKFYKALKKLEVQFKIFTHFSVDDLCFQAEMDISDYLNLARTHEKNNDYLTASNYYRMAQDDRKAIECRLLHIIRTEDKAELMNTIDYVFDHIQDNWQWRNLSS
jgi:hypothetical protein